MRKIIAYLATSADGFIARPDGDVAWLDRPRPSDEYGMPAFLRSVDTVVMGRVTWEAGQKLGGAVVEGKRNIILSRTLPFHDLSDGRAAPAVKNVHHLSLSAGKGRGFSCIGHVSDPRIWSVEKSTVLNFQQRTVSVKGGVQTLRIADNWEPGYVA